MRIADPHGTSGVAPCQQRLSRVGPTESPQTFKPTPNIRGFTTASRPTSARPPKGSGQTLARAGDAGMSPAAAAPARCLILERRTSSSVPWGRRGVALLARWQHQDGPCPSPRPIPPRAIITAPSADVSMTSPDSSCRRCREEAQLCPCGIPPVISCDAGGGSTTASRFARGAPVSFVFRQSGSALKAAPSHGRNAGWDSRCRWSGRVSCRWRRSPGAESNPPR